MSDFDPDEFGVEDFDEFDNIINVKEMEIIKMK
jgi:hypothetical protein